MKNERGLTLVELLAALTLVSIVSLIVISVFTQGTNFSKQALSIDQLNQEANIVVSSMKNIHQGNISSYTVKSSECEISIETVSQTVSFYDQDICFKLETPNTSLENGKEYFPRTEENHAVSFSLTLYDKANVEMEVVIPVYLYRLQEEKQEG